MRRTRKRHTSDHPTTEADFLEGFPFIVAAAYAICQSVLPPGAGRVAPAVIAARPDSKGSSRAHVGFNEPPRRLARPPPPVTQRLPARCMIPGAQEPVGVCSAGHGAFDCETYPSSFPRCRDSQRIKAAPRNNVHPVQPTRGIPNSLAAFL